MIYSHLQETIQKYGIKENNIDELGFQMGVASMQRVLENQK